MGLSTSALRFYESLGLLSTPERVGGKRRYDQSALDRLAMIDVAQRAGFTLREVVVLLDGLRADIAPTEEWRDIATDKLAELELLISRTEAMRSLLRTALECDCLTMEDIDTFRQVNATWAHAQHHASAIAD